MITLLIWEHEQSAVQTREMTMAQAYALAKNGGFYKAQITEAGVVAYEFKS